MRLVGIRMGSEGHNFDTSYDVSLGATLVPLSATLTKLRIKILEETGTLPCNFTFIAPKG